MKINENLVLHNIICGLVVFMFYTLAQSAQNSPNVWAQEQALLYWVTTGVFVVIDVFFNYVMIKD